MNLTHFEKLLQRRYRRYLWRDRAWLVALVVVAYLWAIGYALREW